MTEKLREAARQALEAWDDLPSYEKPSVFHQHVENIRAALAEPEPVQEPVAWTPTWAIDRLTGQLGAVADPVTWGVDAPLYVRATRDCAPLYTAPPPREPLSEEIQELSQQHKFDSRMEKFVRIVEQAHGIKE